MNDATNITTATITSKDAGDKVRCTMTFDWTGVSIEQLRELATGTVVSKVKAEWKAEEAHFPTAAFVTVLDYAVAKRAKRGTGDVSAAKKAVGKLTPEQKAELLALLSQ